MHRALILTLICISTGQEPSDKARLQGNWKVVSVYSGYPERDKDYLSKMPTMEFDGDTIRVRQGSQASTAAFKIDPTKSPKHIDLFGKDPVPQNPEIPLLGIYAIEGDRLKLSWSKIDGEFRPTSFDLAPGNKTRQVSLVLERIKR